MIKEILDLLAISDFYNVGENIDTAKGKYKIPMTFKEGIKHEKRWRKK